MAERQRQFWAFGEGNGYQLHSRRQAAVKVADTRRRLEIEEKCQRARSRLTTTYCCSQSGQLTLEAWWHFILKEFERGPTRQQTCMIEATTDVHDRGLMTSEISWRPSFGPRGFSASTLPSLPAELAEVESRLVAKVVENERVKEEIARLRAKLEGQQRKVDDASLVLQRITDKVKAFQGSEFEFGKEDYLEVEAMKKVLGIASPIEEN